MSEKIELNEQQLAAAQYAGDAKNLLVVAGAGCGKTKTTIARAAHLIKKGTDASRILMMTFTNRAAREVKSRLKEEIGDASNQVTAGTFHGFCLRVMKKIPKSFNIVGLNIIDMDDQNAMIAMIRSKYVKKEEKILYQDFPKSAQLIKYYSYSRNTCQSPEQYLRENSELDDSQVRLCCMIFEEFQISKEQKGYLDFDDLLERFGDALSQKPELRQAVTRLYDEILVDEMQDTNPLQFKILHHFADEGVRLFCVGDPAQSIYRFRGAEFQHVYRFKELFENSEVLNLSLNYRSYQEILDFSNWLLERSPLEYNNWLDADRGTSGYLPSVVDFQNGYDEAGWIADKILERVDGDANFSDMMVLVRSGFDAKPIEAEFIQRGIPYYFIGGTSLTKSAHVRDVLSLLRIVRNVNDDLAWMRFLKLWPRVGTKSAERIIDAIFEKPDQDPIEILIQKLGINHDSHAAYRDTAHCLNSPGEALFQATSYLAPILKERYDKWNQRQRDLELLTTVAKRYTSLGEFIDAFTLEPMTSTEIESIEHEDVVTLITVHSAKGTEAPICFVASAGLRTYPHSRSLGDIDNEEEERRILYVALTRAKNELFVTRSMENRGSFFMQNSEAVGEEYFLKNLPDKLIQNEIQGWNPHRQDTFSSLQDIF